MITSYFGSDICSLCRRKCRAQGRSRVVVCQDCQVDRMRASQLAMTQLNSIQRQSHAIAKECAKCNLCFEDATTFAVVKPGETDNKKVDSTGETLFTPIANCISIDCPNTFERHRLKESETEALAVCEALHLI